MNLKEEVAALVASGNVLVGVDFDGTLAPLVEHPDLAVPDPGALEHLHTLASCDSIEVVVVSGRALSDLRRRLGDLPGVALIGEHGNDTGEDASRSQVIELASGFIQALRGDREVTVETKPRSVTLHTRGLTDKEAREAADQIHSWVADHPAVTLLEGKRVFELTVATRTKGDAIGDLARDRDGIVYIGDDTTDETVFEILGPLDIGVKVGPGPTAARYRVPDVAAVVEVLEAAALEGC